MPTSKDWISAMRLRTLPLAASTALAGGASSLNYIPEDFIGFKWVTFVLILFTIIFLQILSNLANDLGDAVKGTDDENRIGPTRSIQSGAISKLQMKKMIYLFVGLSLISGIASIYTAFDDITLKSMLFLFLGIAAISAAMKYTLGKNPYGYSGFGDVFVFLFFGLIGVMGTDFLLNGVFHWTSIFPAYVLGVFSAAVLNLNNMRDIENDETHGKRTLAVRLGHKKAKEYHYFLILSGSVMAVSLIVINIPYLAVVCLELLLLIPFGFHMKRVLGVTELKKLDPELKKVALLTFLFFLILFAANVYKLNEVS